MGTRFIVIFACFVADDMSTPNVKEGMQAAGVNSILPKEHGTKFYTLPFVKNSEKDVSSQIIILIIMSLKCILKPLVNAVYYLLD